MRLGAISIGQYMTRDRTTRRAVKRWYVRWRIYGFSGLVAQPKRSGFLLKGNADAFADQLRDAEARRNGLVLDTRGYPSRQVETEKASGTSVYEAVGEWVRATNRDLSSGRRRHRATPIARLIAATLTDDNLRDAVLLELDARPRIGRPGPDASLAEAAVYHLRHQHLPGERVVPDSEMTVEELSARDALRGASRALENVSDDEINALWDLLVSGREYETGRAYWAHVKALFRWCRETGRCDRDPLVGRPGVRREPELERVDVGRTPELSEVDRIDAFISQRFASKCDEGLCVQIGAHAMLRISEAVDLRRGDLRNDGERYWVRVRAQSPSRNGQYAWSEARAARGKPKVRVRRDGIEVPLPTRLNARIDAQLERVGAAPDCRVFRGPRQPYLTAETFRSHFETAIASLFPATHRLNGITPHALRHAGVTWLLQAGCSNKRVAKWGRFKRTSVMLDVYEGVLPSDEAHALQLIDRAGEPDCEHP